MIKRYNQFIKENDEFDEVFNEEPLEETEDILSIDDIDDEVTNEEPVEETEVEEEAGDIYMNKLKDLAKELNVELEDGKLEYEGKSIIFPSETEMYHVDRKKFKTKEEVLEYLNKEEKEVSESKSYKKRFKK